jgi:hypothetical protein
MVHAKKDKNWLRIGCLIALSGFILSNGAQAQVTIGSGNPPAKGALLDLKEKDNPGGTTAAKGILLPRVELSGPYSLYPLLKAADAADPTERNTHKGTIVYNVGTNLSEGLYCWDGDKWVKIWGNINDAWLTEGNAGTSAGLNFLGTKDKQPLIFKVNNANAGYIGANNNTAIGFNSTAGLTGGTNNITIGANTTLPYGESNQMNIGNALFGTGMENGAGNIGIGTPTPASTLDVNGSIAGAYHEITNSSYQLSPTDYVVCYNGATNATFYLPDITAPIAGRVYYIKNLTTNVPLTLSAGSAELRRGGTSPVQQTMTVPPGYHTMIVANTNTSGQVWDVLSLQDSHIATTGWVLVATDLMSIVDEAQVIAAPDNSYHDVDKTTLTVTVPADVSNDNRVLLRWDVWGAVRAKGTTGSIRFAVKEESDARGSAQHAKVMTTSWSTPTENYFRWTAPVAFALKGVPPGTYKFTLQIRREEEGPDPPPIMQPPTVWGVQGKAEVYIK